MWTLLKSGRRTGWPLPLGIWDKWHVALILPKSLSYDSHLRAKAGGAGAAPLSDPHHLPVPPIPFFSVARSGCEPSRR